MTTIQSSTRLTGVLSFLNLNRIKYTVCRFSPSYTEEQIEQDIARLGLGMLEAVTLNVQGKGPILVITPASLALDFTEFSKLLAPFAIRTLAPTEIGPGSPCSPPENILPPLCGLFGLESFLSPLIEKHGTIGFFVESTTTLITLEASEFRRTLSNTSAIPVPTRPKYRAYATPGRKANEGCILGVSLENADFHTPKLLTIAAWVRNHYSRCLVMLGDGLHRITLQLDSDAPEDEALEHSKWLARDFVHSQGSVFTLTGSSCPFDFVFCSEIQAAHHSYSNYYNQVTALFHDNKAFQDSCRAFAYDFLKRKPRRQQNNAKHIEMSCRYVLEELAVISCLTQGFPCSFVYPGSLTILEEIARGKHPWVPECLLTIDYVELKLKSRHKLEGK